MNEEERYPCPRLVADAKTTPVSVDTILDRRNRPPEKQCRPTDQQIQNDSESSLTRCDSADDCEQRWNPQVGIEPVIAGVIEHHTGDEAQYEQDSVQWHWWETS